MASQLSRITSLGASNEVRVIAYGLYGADARYTVGVLRNALLAPLVYPGWKVRTHSRTYLHIRTFTHVLARTYRPTYRRTYSLTDVRTGWLADCRHTDRVHACLRADVPSCALLRAWCVPGACLVRACPLTMRCGQVRVYLDGSVPATVVSELEQLGAQLVRADGSAMGGGIGGMFWRFLVAADMEVATPPTPPSPHHITPSPLNPSFSPPSAYCPCPCPCPCPCY